MAPKTVGRVRAGMDVYETLYLDSPWRVLLLDGDDVARRVLAWQLRQLKMDVRDFGTGVAGREHLASQFVDLLLVEADLPDEEGSAVLAAVRSLPAAADLPVFVLTGDPSAGQVARALAIGVRGCLLKPVPNVRLRDTCQELEGEWAHRREVHFMRHLMASLEQPELDPDRRQRLVGGVQRTEFFRRFIQNPTVLPLAYRVRLARILREVVPDLDRQLLERVDANDDLRALETLSLVEEVLGDRHPGYPLTRLVGADDIRVATKAVKLLGKTGADVAWLHRFMNHENPRFVANLLESLWDSRQPAVVGVFRRFAGAEDPRVRANSLVGLHRQGHPAEAMGGLIRMIGSPRLDMVRSALWACGQIGAAAMGAELASLSTHPDPQVRAAAAGLLGAADG